MAMTRAYRVGKVLVVANLQYTGIIFSSLWGMLLWGDVFDWHVWLGMGVILASGIAATFYNTGARRAAPSSRIPIPSPANCKDTMYTTLIERRRPGRPHRRSQLGDRRLPPRPRNLAAGRAAYAAGHLPHALFADMETELSGAKRGPDGAFRGRHPLPEKEAFIELLRTLGRERRQPGRGLRRPRRHVRGAPVVDAALGRPRSRGGARWRPAGLAGGRASRCRPIRRPRAARRIALRAALVTTVDVNAVLHNVEHGGGRTVVDARAPDRFRGENETIDPVGGHIPGAKNRFFKDNLQADGRFKAPAQLQAELGAWSAIRARPSCSAAPA
jgi:hypothetical protein